jgi:hypothetical protein
VAVSPDNGASWNPYPVNVSKTAHFEEAFVSTPEIVSGATLSMVYQGDIEPGTIMNNDDVYDDNYKNLMIVQSVPIAQLMTLSLDSTAPCGQFELPLGVRNVVNNEIGVVGLYPNPAGDYANISMRFLGTAAAVEIQLIDFTGSRISASTFKNVHEETVKIDTRALTAGVYLIKVITADGFVMKRMIKE